MTRQEIKNPVRKYVYENFLYTRPEYEFSDSDSLLRLGIIDSLGVAELIAFIEDEFAIEVGDDDISEENLASLDGIADFVHSKRGESIAAVGGR